MDVITLNSAKNTGKDQVRVMGPALHCNVFSIGPWTRLISN